MEIKSQEKYECVLRGKKKRKRKKKKGVFQERQSKFANKAKMMGKRSI